MDSAGKVIISLGLALCLLISLPAVDSDAGSPLVKGGKLPAFNLPIPKDAKEGSYLGLSGKGYFKIPQIRAQAVIVTILSLYCPVCQNTASVVAELYRDIENNPDLKDKMKLIGIGAGNTPHEVEVLKEQYHIPFPVFPDKDFEVHKALGNVRAPYFIAVKIDGDGSHEVVHTQLGGMIEAQPFLDALLEAYGFKQKDSPEKGKDLAVSLAH